MPRSWPSARSRGAGSRILWSRANSWPLSFVQNRPVLEEFVGLAGEVGCTPGQLALAWLLNRAPHIVPIPGTRSVAHFDENLAAVGVQLDGGVVKALERLFAVGRISGDRYPPATQLEIDTEEFA
jgi:aryl-alcohol dehydrogenase-like predicted oxidoreductase